MRSLNTFRWYSIATILDAPTFFSRFFGVDTILNRDARALFRPDCISKKASIVLNNKQKLDIPAGSWIANHPGYSICINPRNSRCRVLHNREEPPPRAPGKIYQQYPGWYYVFCFHCQRKGKLYSPNWSECSLTLIVGYFHTFFYSYSRFSDSRICVSDPFFVPQYWSDFGFDRFSTFHIIWTSGF